MPKRARKPAANAPPSVDTSRMSDAEFVAYIRNTRSDSGAQAGGEE